MQYKQTIKLVIDKRKLDILIRIGCPDEKLLELIKTGTFTKTGDQMIDDTLECLIDFKEFDNWGGKREGAGRPKKNQIDNQNEIQVENRDENHLDNQVGNQDANQVADKDKDIGKDINNNTRGDSKGGDKNLSLGELGLVRLTQEQYNQLKERYGQENLHIAIEKLDTWLGTTGTKHNLQNHYAYFKSNSWVWGDMRELTPEDRERAKEQAESQRRSEEFHKQAESVIERLQADKVYLFPNDIREICLDLLRKYREKKKQPDATLADLEKSIGYDKLKKYIQKRG